MADPHQVSSIIATAIWEQISKSSGLFAQGVDPVG
jgi:hypothetical protein